MSCLIDKETLDDFHDNYIMLSLCNQKTEFFLRCVQRCQEIISVYKGAFPNDCAQLDFLLWLRRHNLIRIPDCLVAMREVVKYMYDHFDEIYKPPKIFISHAEKDSIIVKKFVTMLERLGVKQSQLFCSSVIGYGIPQGVGSIYDYIRNEMSNDNLFVILMLSKKYYSSPMCLNEMGAAWLKKSQYQSILLPGFKFLNIKGAIDPRDMSFELADKQKRNQALNELKDRIVAHLSLEPVDYSCWEQFRNDFALEVDNLPELTQK